MHLNQNEKSTRALRYELQQISSNFAFPPSCLFFVFSRENQGFLTFYVLNWDYFLLFEKVKLREVGKFRFRDFGAIFISVGKLRDENRREFKNLLDFKQKISKCQVETCKFHFHKLFGNDVTLSRLMLLKAWLISAFLSRSFMLFRLFWHRTFCTVKNYRSFFLQRLRKL